MKFTVFSCCLFFAQFLGAQGVVPFVDFNNWFRTVTDGELRYIELQQIKSYSAGDNLVAYLDIRGNLRVFDGKDRVDLSNVNLEYKISDNLLAWNYGPVLQLWDHGEKKTLGYFAGNYILKDNLMLYENTRYNSITCYWNGKEYPIQTATGTIALQNSPKIGENIFAFADNGNIYRIFYEGNTYEVGVWNGDINFQSGTDIVAFNDPTTRTFAAFDKGTFVDVETQWVKKYKAGRGFIVYEDINNNLMMYRNGEKRMLSSFPGNWDVLDDVVLFENNGFSYVSYDDKEVEIANYKIENYIMKNGTVVFTTIQGGVKAIIQGEIVELTNLLNSEYEIYGNSVLVKLMNKNFLIYQNGKLIRA